MNELVKMFEGKQLRIVQSNDEVRFLLRDVCDILNLGQVAGLVRRLEDEVISNHPIIDSLGREVQAKFVNEDGLYDAVLESRKPEAKRFRKWITSDVLPSIRKHGAYMTPETIEQALMDPDTIIRIATELKEERTKRISAESKIIEDKKYTDFGKVVEMSDAAISIGAFVKIVYDKHGINIGRNKMFEWLREKGYLIKNGRERNNPKQHYLDQGLFELRPTIVKRTEGYVQTNTTLVTGKGQVRLAEALLREFSKQKAI